MGPLGPAGPPFPLVQPTSRYGSTGSLGAFPLLSVWTRSKTGCSVLLCEPTGPDRSTGSPHPAEFTSGPPGYTGVFSIPSVISPSKADCSVVLCGLPGPTGPPVQLVQPNSCQGPLGTREYFPSRSSSARARPTARSYFVGPLGPTGPLVHLVPSKKRPGHWVHGGVFLFIHLRTEQDRLLGHTLWAHRARPVHRFTLFSQIPVRAPRVRGSVSPRICIQWFSKPFYSVSVDCPP